MSWRGLERAIGVWAFTSLGGWRVSNGECGGSGVRAYNELEGGCLSSGLGQLRQESHDGRRLNLLFNSLGNTELVDQWVP